jgi:hypothetical protein
MMTCESSCLRYVHDTKWTKQFESKICQATSVVVTIPPLFTCLWWLICNLVVFYGSLFNYLSFSFGHCIVCTSTYGLFLPFWYLQTCFITYVTTTDVAWHILLSNCFVHFVSWTYRRQELSQVTRYIIWSFLPL